MKVSRAQLDHFAGANEQHVRLTEIRNNPAGQPHCRARHRYRRGADARFTADFLGDRECALEQAIQQDAEAARLPRDLFGHLDLTEDLGFRRAPSNRVRKPRETHDVQRFRFPGCTGCHPARRPRASAPPSAIGAAMPDRAHCSRVRCGCRETIAAVNRRAAIVSLAPASGQLGRRERELLLQRQWRGLVIEAENDEIHQGCSG